MEKDHPLRRLWRYADRHRGRVIWATVLTIANKVFDVFPEILIGFAVDVVVREDDSFVADLTGIDDRWGQLLVLAAVNVAVWVGESVTEWGAAVVWRNLSQTIEHEARIDAYSHVQRLELGYFEDQSTGGLMTRAQRRRQPARALPRRRGEHDHLDGRQRRPRRRRLLRRHPRCSPRRVRADPGDRLGQLPLPAPRGAAIQGGAGPGRRAQRDPRRTTSAASRRSRPSPPRTTRSPGSATASQAYARPTATPSP